MAKCTETCPKCGSESTYDKPHVFGDYVAKYWGCGSKEINGEFKQYTDCLIRELHSRLAAANAEIERLRAENKLFESALEMTLETYNKTVHAGLELLKGDHPHA